MTSIWCAEKELEGRELDDEAAVRLRTKGDGPYLGEIKKNSVIYVIFFKQVKIQNQAGICLGEKHNHA